MTNDDVQDLVFFSETRPVFLRLHVRIDDKPFRAVWDEYMQKVFDFLDTNGDGVLSKEEAERVPNAQFLREYLQGVIGGFSPDETKTLLAQLDTNKDGKVSRQELTEYYRRSGFSAVRTQPLFGAGMADSATASLFKHLDSNKDGKLSKEEMARAVEVLHKADLDEDEMVTLPELLPDLFGNPYRFQVYDGDGRVRRPDSGFLTITPGEKPARLKQELMTRYDKNKNGKLSRSEAGLEKETFDALDKNGDGELDGDELAGFLERPSDIELIVRLTKRPLTPLPPVSVLGAYVQLRPMPREAPAELFNPKQRAMPLAAAVRRSEDGAVRITLEGTQTELTRGEGRGGNYNGVKQFYLEQFKIADTNKKGFIEKKQAEGTDFLSGFFRLADRDGDNKLTEQELTVFLDLHGQGAGSETTLTLGENGRGLYELLDANRDGRLSVRELRTAWDRLALYDRDGAGLIDKTAIPRQFQLTVSLGDPNLRQRFFTGGVSTRRPTPPRGPLWFRKMDRNSDGDVSLREFLGSEEEFKRIDTDGDGLLSLEEAERYDALMRKQQEQR